MNFSAYLFWTTLAIVTVSKSFAKYAGCDYYQKILPGKSYDVFSPRYPLKYRSNTNCRWAGVAPIGYKVLLICNNFALPASTRCWADKLAVSRTGRTDLANAHNYCGTGSFTTESIDNAMVIALQVPNASRGGAFRCQMQAHPNNCVCGRRKAGRIVGGEETQVNEFPMMAAIIDSTTNMVLCGATIIDKQYVLTAAHCLTNRAIGSYYVRVGEHDLGATTETPYTANYNVASQTIHPNYMPNPTQNDVAVIRLTTPIVYNEGVGPACLPFKFTSKTFAGDKLEAAGWGTIEFGGPRSPKLQKVTLDGISTSECQTRLPTADIMNSQLCTFTPDKDACQMDSGGPLYYTDPSNGLVYDAGIISFGVACASNDPGVATRTTSYLSWITSNTPGAVYCRI